MVNQLREKLLNQLMADKEKSIINAINKRIGDDWSYEQLKGRCEMHKARNGTEVYMIDGVEIIRFSGLELIQH